MLKQDAEILLDFLHQGLENAVSNPSAGSLKFVVLSFSAIAQTLPSLVLSVMRSGSRDKSSRVEEIEAEGIS